MCKSMVVYGGKSFSYHSPDPSEPKTLDFRCDDNFWEDEQEFRYNSEDITFGLFCVLVIFMILYFLAGVI